MMMIKSSVFVAFVSYWLSWRLCGSIRNVCLSISPSIICLYVVHVDDKKIREYSAEDHKTLAKGPDKSLTQGPNKKLLL